MTAQCCSSRDGTKQTPCHEGTSAWDASCRSLPFSVGSLLLCPSCRASALHTPTSSLGHDLPQLPMPCQPGSTATVAQRTTRRRPRGNSARIITVRALRGMEGPSMHRRGVRRGCTAGGWRPLVLVVDVVWQVMIVRALVDPNDHRLPPSAPRRHPCFPAAPRAPPRATQHTTTHARPQR